MINPGLFFTPDQLKLLKRVLDDAEVYCSDDDAFEKEESIEKDFPNHVRDYEFIYSEIDTVIGRLP